MRRRERRDLTRRIDQVEPLIERRFGCPACRTTLIRIDSPGRPADDRCASCGRSLLIVRLAFDPHERDRMRHRVADLSLLSASSIKASAALIEVTRNLAASVRATRRPRRLVQRIAAAA